MPCDDADLDVSGLADPYGFLADLAHVQREVSALAAELDLQIAQADAVLAWIREQRRARGGEEVVLVGEGHIVARSG